jgi:hypothetical protein
MKNLDFYKITALVLLLVIAWSLFIIANKKESGNGRFSYAGEGAILDTKTGALYMLQSSKESPSLISKRIIE